MFGTDFDLIARMLANRNHNQVKRKFNREDRINRQRIEEALRCRLEVPASLLPTLDEEDDNDEPAAAEPQTDAAELEAASNGGAQASDTAIAAATMVSPSRVISH